MDPFDADFAERFKAGDAAAFSELDEHFRPLLFGYLCKHVKTHQDAEDLVQVTLLRAWQKRDQFKPECGTIMAWLFTMAKRLLVDRCRSEARIIRGGRFAQSSLEDYDLFDEDCPRLNAERAETRAIVRKVIRRLPSDARRVIRLRMKGTTNKDVGAEFGIAKQTVQARINNAFEMVRSERVIRQIVLQELG
jgi:RNA polymerase sigma factor (sigma-70 family)